MIHLVSLVSVISGLSLLVPSGALLARHELGRYHQAKHQQTLQNIRRLEIANGVKPEDYWNQDYPATYIGTRQIRSADAYQPPLVQVFGSPYLFTPTPQRKQSDSEPEPYPEMNPKQQLPRD